MASPYTKKHFLEMSDREREAQREEDRFRPGRDAIEGVYPEQFVVPAGRLALSTLRGAIAKQAKPAPTVQMPGEFKPHGPMNTNRQTVFKADPKSVGVEAPKRTRNEILLERLRQSDVKKAKEKAIDDTVDAATTAASLPVLQNFGPEEYSRGGKVKTKSHRGDGITQRGKTRGRFV